jgi:hypothetical protein
MKIMAVTDSDRYNSRYLVEVSQAEFLKAAGYRYTSDARKDHPKAFAFTDSDIFRIGAELKVSDAFDYLVKLRDNDKACRDAAELLRDTAKMIDGAVPTTIVPPTDAGSSGKG